MSVEAMTWAFRQSHLSDGCARLLLVLADYADDDGVCWPSRARLAERIAKSVDTVDRRAAELIAEGLIAIESRNRTTGDGKIVPLSNVYKLNLDAGHTSRKSAATGSRKNAAGRTLENQAPDGEGVAAKVRLGGGGISAASREDAAEVAAEARPGWPQSYAARVAATGAATRESTIEPSNSSSSLPRARGSTGGLIGTAGELVALVNHPKLDPVKAPGLVTTMTWVESWRRLGLSDLEMATVICVVLEKRDQRDPGADLISTWNFFTKAMREHAEDKRAAQIEGDVHAGSDPSRGERMAGWQASGRGRRGTGIVGAVARARGGARLD